MVTLTRNVLSFSSTKAKRFQNSLGLVLLVAHDPQLWLIYAMSPLFQGISNTWDNILAFSSRKCLPQLQVDHSCCFHGLVYFCSFLAQIWCHCAVILNLKLSGKTRREQKFANHAYMVHVIKNIALSDVFI